MKKVYEFCTWSTSPEWKAKEIEAVNAGKAHKGSKFTVAIGEWGVSTYLVLADSKEEAKALAVEEHEKTGKQADKIKVRDVTNCKKYN